MALGYFPVVPILLLLESAKITGEATTQVTTFPPTSVPTSEPHHFTSVSDTTGGMETTTPAVGTTKFLPSSVALLSDPNHPWSTLGEKSTPDDTAVSSLAVTSIPSASFGGPSKEGVSLPSESTMRLIRSTTQEMNSSSQPPTTQEKMTSEGPLTTISTTSPAETTSDKDASSLPLTNETITTSPLLFPLLTSTLVTSTPMSATSGHGDTTGSSEVSTASPITRWWPGSSLFPTYSAVTQDGSTPKVTSTGLLSSNPGRTSLGLSAPSSTNPTSEFPAATVTVIPSIPTSPSASTSLREIAGEATTQVTTSPTSVPTSEPHHFTSVSDTTGGMETTTPAVKTTESLPSSVVLLSDVTRPWSALAERSTPDDTAASSLAMTSIPSASFGGPSKEGVTLPLESTVLLIRSTTQEMNSSSQPPTPQEKMTSEGPLTTITTTSPAETPSEKHASSLPLTTETITTSPLSFPLLTSTLVTSTPTSATSGLGDATGSSEVSTASEAPITRWWPGSSLFPTYSSVTQDGSTPKVTSVGPLSSNPGRSSLGPSGPSSTNPTKQSPGTTLKALSPISPSPSASEGLSQAPARNRFILSVRFSTTLNIADLSVRRAMLKWLDHELQAKFPVGSFHLTWVG